MAHEITNTDGAVFHRERAWHGLGIVVESAPTPHEAITLAGLDWGITQKPLYIMDGDQQRLVETHVANYRQDTQSLLGVVTAGYHPISNADIADFCEAIGKGNNIRCESVGSIRGGKRVWFLLKGEPFAVANDDEIYPYILVSNGNDGGASFRVTPTTVRVVCSNTMHMVVPRTDTGELLGSAMSFRHSCNVMDRVQDAQEALQNYQNAQKGTKEVIGALARKQVDRATIEQFFLEAYATEWGVPPTETEIAKESDAKAKASAERKRAKAISAFQSFSRRFDDERAVAGTTAWNALNAFTGMVQHDMKARGKDDADRVERRMDSNLFGLGQERTQRALQQAMQLVG